MKKTKKNAIKAQAKEIPLVVTKPVQLLQLLTIKPGTIFTCRKSGKKDLIIGKIYRESKNYVRFLNNSSWGSELSSNSNGFSYRKTVSCPPEGITRNELMREEGIVDIQFYKQLPGTIMMPGPILKIGGHSVTFGEHSIGVGCTRVTKEQVAEVARRLGLIPKDTAKPVKNAKP